MVSGIVAEVSNAHNGDKDRAHRLIDAIADAGADWIKFQCYMPDELVALRGDGKAPEPWGSDGWTMYDLYTRAQTPHSWFPDLVEHCERIGLPWFSSVFGPDSLDLLERLSCPVYKLASLDVERDAFRKMVMAKGKLIIQSVPRRSLIPANFLREKAFELWCPPGYPQEPPDLDTLINAMHWATGFSYHGTDPHVPQLAVAAGSGITEVHVQLDDEPSELEPNVSLTISQLAGLVEACK